MEEVAVKKNRTRKALSIEARERQVADLALDAAEERIRNGTATSQEIVYFLKIGSSRERTEKEKLQKEIDMLVAKVESLKAAATSEELYANAIKAIGIYQGKSHAENLQ